MEIVQRPVLRLDAADALFAGRAVTRGVVVRVLVVRLAAGTSYVAAFAVLI
jgi:hypothetical protein